MSHDSNSYFALNGCDDDDVDEVNFKNHNYLKFSKGSQVN